ncbi:unnamed protein product [Cochlearia groenlandica]
MDDFFLNDFSLENIDFHFFSYEKQVKESVDIVDHVSLKQADNFVDARYLAEEAIGCENIDEEYNMSKETCEEVMSTETSKPMMKIKNKPRVISFDFSNNNVSSSLDDHEKITMDRLVLGRVTKRKVCSSSSSTRSPVLAKEHVMAERKRGEKLSQKFIALSALLPGLKKADKLSVLDDETSHIKQLHEQLREFEEEKESTKEIKYMILVKKSKVFFDEETNYLSSSPSHHENLDQALPEIEAKISQNQVLIRIHCKKRKMCMISILNMIENVHLRVENSVILPFGESILDITVLAEVIILTKTLNLKIM